MLTARLARLRLVCAPSCGGRGSLVASLGGASERLEGFESCRRLFVNYFRKEIQLSVRSVSAHQTLLVKTSGLRCQTCWNLTWNLCARN
jgi:hypothetical protein